MTSSRIAELAVQVGAEEVAPFDFHFRQRQLEQFVQLLAQECVTLCNDTQKSYRKHRMSTSDFQDKNMYAEGEAACDVIRFNIKKHFGIAT
jgi:hypothetical protein